MDDAVGFEWDPFKAEANQTKHGVSFAEAAIAEDPDAAPIMDEAWTDHSFTVRLVTDEADKAR